MASGQQHDRATWILALPFGLLWGPWLGLGGVMVGGLAFLIGGLWLSPISTLAPTPAAAGARYGCSGGPTGGCSAIARSSPIPP